jgi:formamidase
LAGVLSGLDPPSITASGTFRLPWEDQVKTTDGTSSGFPAPLFGKVAKAAE